MSAPVEKYHQPVPQRLDWETPASVFDPLNAEFGFTLDVCATKENAKCARYFTPEQDGLSQDWGANVCWMNPPYGREIVAWMRKAYDSALNGATVVCLVPARTDSGWWHDYAMRATAINFRRGRIKFVGAKWGAPFGCAEVLFQPGLAVAA